MNWVEVNRTIDDVAVVAGVIVLVVRQFLWRSADPARILRTPLVVVAIGLVAMAWEVVHGFRWVPADWIITGELALVAVTGTAMGTVTRFRGSGPTLQYRLTTPGVWLWAAFVAVRLGCFALAAALGADLPAATGMILLSFGVNRLAATLVVRRRIRALLEQAPEPAPSTRTTPAQ